MAMRQRLSGISNTTAGRSRQSYRPIYEDFKPQFELKEVSKAHIINVQLPGFLKEQLRMTFVHSPGEIIARGQRPLGNNTWSRFNETFPLPQNSEPSKIHGNFHNGVLTITVPKEVITHVASPKEEEEEEGAKPAADAQQPQKDSHHDEKVSSKEKDHTPAALEPKFQKGQDAIHQPAIATAAARYDKPGDTVSVPSKEQKGIPETKGTAGTQKQNDKEGSLLSTLIPNETQRDNKRVIPLSSSSPQNTAVEPKSQKDTHEILPKVTELTNKNLGEAKNAVDGTPLHNREEIIHGKRLSTKEDVIEKLAPNTLDKVKKKRKQSGSGEHDKQPKEDGTNAGKQERASVIRWINDEEKQLLINMGAALLVLVAFGANTSYNFWCSGKTKN